MFDRLIPYALVALILIAYAIVGTMEYNDLINDHETKTVPTRSHNRAS